MKDRIHADEDAGGQGQHRFTAGKQADKPGDHKGHQNSNGYNHRQAGQFRITGGHFNLLAGFPLIFQQVRQAMENNIQFAGHFSHSQHIDKHTVKQPGMAGKSIGKLTAHLHKSGDIE